MDLIPAMGVDRQFGFCGGLAGLAGWVLVVGTSARHNLFPLISSGYGFLAILVVLLANLSALWSYQSHSSLQPFQWVASNWLFSAN
jgi:simple sugar transport system permease protein